MQTPARAGLRTVRAMWPAATRRRPCSRRLCKLWGPGSLRGRQRFLWIEIFILVALALVVSKAVTATVTAIVTAIVAAIITATVTATVEAALFLVASVAGSLSVSVVVDG